MESSTVLDSYALNNSGIDIIRYEEFSDTLNDVITGSYDRDGRVFEPVFAAVIKPGAIHFDWLGRVMCIYFPKGVLPSGTRTRARMVNPGPIEIVYTFTDGSKYAYATNQIIFYTKCSPTATAYYTIGQYAWGCYDSTWSSTVQRLVDNTSGQVEYGWGCYYHNFGGCNFSFVALLPNEWVKTPTLS